MRFRPGALLILLATVAIVACSRGIDSTPAPTILSAGANTPVPGEDTPRPGSTGQPPAATATPALPAGQTPTARVNPTPTPFPTPTKPTVPIATPSPAGKTAVETAAPISTVQPTPTPVATPTPAEPAEPTPTPTQFPTDQATPAPATPPSPTAVPQPTPSATVEPSPTPTVQPTATPTPTPAPTPTNTAETTPTATAGPVPPAEIDWVDNPDCQLVDKGPLRTIAVKLNWRDVEEVVISEVAATSAQRSQGLMCRGTVADGSGMLFLFDQPRDGGFWMFNTYTPLDILYIDASGIVIWNDTMHPCPRQSSESDNVWRSRCAARTSRPDTSLGGYTAALELPAGWLEQTGIGPDLAGEMIVSWE